MTNDEGNLLVLAHARPCRAALMRSVLSLDQTVGFGVKGEVAAGLRHFRSAPENGRRPSCSA
jgi:hypothetical protein